MLCDEKMSCPEESVMIGSLSKGVPQKSLGLEKDKLEGF